MEKKLLPTVIEALQSEDALQRIKQFNRLYHGKELELDVILPEIYTKIPAESLQKILTRSQYVPLDKEGNVAKTDISVNGNSGNLDEVAKIVEAKPWEAHHYPEYFDGDTCVSSKMIDELIKLNEYWQNRKTEVIETRWKVEEITTKIMAAQRNTQEIKERIQDESVQSQERDQENPETIEKKWDLKEREKKRTEEELEKAQSTLERLNAKLEAKKRSLEGLMQEHSTENLTGLIEKIRINPYSQLFKDNLLATNLCDKTTKQTELQEVKLEIYELPKPEITKEISLPKKRSRMYTLISTCALAFGIGIFGWQYTISKTETCQQPQIKQKTTYNELKEIATEIIKKHLITSKARVDYNLIPNAKFGQIFKIGKTEMILQAIKDTIAGTELITAVFHRPGPRQEIIYNKWGIKEDKHPEIEIGIIEIPDGEIKTIANLADNTFIYAYNRKTRELKAGRLKTEYFLYTISPEFEKEITRYCSWTVYFTGTREELPIRTEREEYSIPRQAKVFRNSPKTEIQTDQEKNTTLPDAATNKFEQTYRLNFKDKIESLDYEKQTGEDTKWNLMVRAVPPWAP